MFYRKFYFRSQALDGQLILVKSTLRLLLLESPLLLGRRQFPSQLQGRPRRKVGPSSLTFSLSVGEFQLQHEEDISIKYWGEKVFALNIQIIILQYSLIYCKTIHFSTSEVFLTINNNQYLKENLARQNLASVKLCDRSKTIFILRKIENWNSVTFVVIKYN